MLLIIQSNTESIREQPITSHFVFDISLILWYNCGVHRAYLRVQLQCIVYVFHSFSSGQRHRKTAAACRIVVRALQV